MRFRSIFAALAVVAAACDNDPTAPHAPVAPSLRGAPPTTHATLDAASYIATWSHTVLPLYSNVQVNQVTAFGDGINEDGVVAGVVEGPYDGYWFSVPRATLWTAAGAQNLGVLPPGSPSQRSYATDVNDAGMVSGWGTTLYGTGVCCGLVRGFLWTQSGGMKPLLPSVPSDQATTRGHAINAVGHVAGHEINAAGELHAVVWFDPAAPAYVIGAAGASASASDINDVGQVVGTYAGGAFVWSAQDGLTDLSNLGGPWVVPNAINNLGMAVGWSETADGTMHPFRWTAAGGMEDLGLPPGATNAYANDITKSGRIVVSAESYDDSGYPVSRLFLWADGQWIDLGPANVGSTYGGAVNEKLQITGSGYTGQTSGPTAMRWDVALAPATPAFTFTGFFAPIQNLPVVNRVKAGQGIPVKFSLGGDQGLTIFAPGFPSSQQIACDGNAPVDEVETTVTAGGSSLSFEATTGVYSYIWKTEASWAGTCRSLTVRLTDGSEHSAHFRFVR